MPLRAAPAAPAAAALALVPGLEQGARPMRLQRLRGGTVNESWRVDTARGRFVLRIDGLPAHRIGVDRGRERIVHDAAARAGLAPRVWLWDEAAGVQVREFVDARAWGAGEMARRQPLAQLGKRLGQLHELAPPGGVGVFDPLAHARLYREAIGAAGRVALAADAAVAELRTAAVLVADAAARPAIVHGDLAHGNVLGLDRPILIDWEYAQLADPVYDLACLLAYYPRARPHAPRLLAAAGLDGPGGAARLAAAVRVYERLSWLWQQARQSG